MDQTLNITYPTIDYEGTKDKVVQDIQKYLSDEGHQPDVIINENFNLITVTEMQESSHQVGQIIHAVLNAHGNQDCDIFDFHISRDFDAEDTISTHFTITKYEW